MPGEKVYAGMVVGQSGKTEDIELNVCKTKHLTNTRSSSADEALKLTPPKKLSLEEALEFIETDELLEITPESLRIRKKILDSTQRFRASKKNRGVRGSKGMGVKIWECGGFGFNTGDFKILSPTARSLGEIRSGA